MSQEGSLLVEKRKGCKKSDHFLWESLFKTLPCLSWQCPGSCKVGNVSPNSEVPLIFWLSVLQFLQIPFWSSVYSILLKSSSKMPTSCILQILNKYDSWISFLSSVRYWMAFNIERACQSYFGCVQCISGPLGMYRNSLLHEFVEDWYNQEFMGSQCSFGDDRHLTNRVLSLGYATKYTARSKCLTETPIEYLRWLNQQTRWSKSYFREWLYNAMWFHKHHLWMTYEAVITGFFPFFLIATVIQLFYRGKIWNILLFLLTVQLVGLIKSSFASFLRGNIVMVFMSLYSVLYMSSLLPAKMFAIATINKAGWGTSGRKTIVVNFIGLIPVSIWFTILLGGVIFTIYKESKKPFSESKTTVLVIGTILYACYWVLLLTLYLVLITKCGRRKKEQHYDMVLDVWCFCGKLPREF